MKLILAIFAVVISLGSSSLWLFVSESEAERDRREKFFGTTKDYPTSGGEKMKVEW